MMSFRSFHNVNSMGMGTMPGTMMCGTTCAALKIKIFPRCQIWNGRSVSLSKPPLVSQATRWWVALIFHIGDSPARLYGSDYIFESLSGKFVICLKKGNFIRPVPIHLSQSIKKGGRSDGARCGSRAEPGPVAGAGRRWIGSHWGKFWRGMGGFLHTPKSVTVY